MKVDHWLAEAGKRVGRKWGEDVFMETIGLENNF